MRDELFVRADGRNLATNEDGSEAHAVQPQEVLQEGWHRMTVEEFDDWTDAVASEELEKIARDQALRN